MEGEMSQQWIIIKEGKLNLLLFETVVDSHTNLILKPRLYR